MIIKVFIKQYLINSAEIFEMGGSDVHDMSYYGKCMIGGILSCGLTHMVVCPLDIVKCRKQVRLFQIKPD